MVPVDFVSNITLAVASKIGKEQLKNTVIYNYVRFGTSQLTWGLYILT